MRIKREKVSTLLNCFSRQFKQIWLGRKSLLFTFWIVMLCGNLLCLAVLGVLSPNDILARVWLCILPIYFVFSFKSLLSCLINYNRKGMLALEASIFIIFVVIGVLLVKLTYSGEVVATYEGTIVDQQWSAGKNGINLAVVRLETGIQVEAWCSHKQENELVEIEERVGVLEPSEFEYVCSGQVN